VPKRRITAQHPRALFAAFHGFDPTVAACTPPGMRRAANGAPSLPPPRPLRTTRATALATARR
jgi:hypothetical protein